MEVVEDADVKVATEAAAQVGPALNYSNLDSLPGAAGVPGQSNHYAHNQGVIDAPVSTSNTLPKVMSGGRRTRRKRRRCCKKRNNRKSKRGGVGKNTGKRNVIRQHGGSGGLIRSRLFPTEIVNLTRNVLHAPRKLMNSWGGYEQPANLDFNPTHQPIGKLTIPQLKVGSRILSGETKTSVKGTAKLNLN